LSDPTNPTLFQALPDPADLLEIPSVLLLLLVEIEFVEFKAVELLSVLLSIWPD
jgi:hypothetical protein